MEGLNILDTRPSKIGLQCYQECAIIKSHKLELEVAFPKGQLDTVSASEEANMD
jgi:hypothetical protein